MDDGREDAGVVELPSRSADPVVVEEPTLHYLDVRPPVPGHWPEKNIRGHQHDGGWDDDTVVAPVALSE